MATTSEASRLQYAGASMRFTFFTVGLLAMFGLVGCGVGVDDVEGQQAAGYTATSSQAQSDQAALIGLDGTPVPQDDGSAPSGGGPANPGVSSLPTDPVPWRNPVTNEGVDPMLDPVTGLPTVPGGVPPAPVTK